MTSTVFFEKFWIVNKCLRDKCESKCSNILNVILRLMLFIVGS